MLRWLFVAAALVLITLTLPRWFSFNDTTLIALVAARWLIGIAAAGLALCALLTRDLVAILACASVAAVHAVIAAPSFLGSTTPASADSITVLSSNLEYGKADLDELARASDRLNVDVLVITEAAYLGDRLETSGLTERFPYRQGRSDDDARGTIVLSRWPSTLLAAGRDTVFDQPLVQIQTPHGPLQVKGVHSASPGHPTWRSELEEQAQTPAGSIPLLLAGDFNASADHAPFRAITARFSDAHAQVGAGWVRTWNMKGLPFVQIDHVLLHKLRAQDAGVVDLDGTDHRAVWARVVMT